MQFSKKALLVAITGPDGSGKSLLCRRMTELMQSDYSLSVRIASIWDVKDDLPGLSYGNLQKCFAALNPVASSLAIFYALHHCLELAERASPNIILYDAYCYKYAVSGLVRGVDYRLMTSLISTLPVPDCVIYLQTSPATTEMRKQVLSPYETNHGNPSLKGKTRFLAAQHQGLRYWQKLQVDYGPWILIDAEQGACEVFDEALSRTIDLFSPIFANRAAQELC